MGTPEARAPRRGFPLSRRDIIAAAGPAAQQGIGPATIDSIAGLNEALPSSLSFLGNPRYARDVPSTRAGIVLLPLDYDRSQPHEGQLYLHCAHPSLALAAVCRLVEAAQFPRPAPGIHSRAVVAESAVIAESAHIGPGCVIGDNVSIGDRTTLWANVTVGADCVIGPDCTLHPSATLYPATQLGARVTVHAGAVIGSDGYGYEFIDGTHQKVPQIGHVCVGDDVEIGANTTIDRARFGVTHIGAGTKIDNLVQIAHNVEVGRHCLLVSQCGISGSTKLGDYVTIAGQAGLVGHIEIPPQTIIGARAGITNSLKEPGVYRGAPAMPMRQANTVDVLYRRLPELYARIKALEARLADGGG
mgnify:FL=1